MLVMKAWLETRWRLAFYAAISLLYLAISYHNRNSQPAHPQAMLILLGTVLACGSLAVAGSGVKSQAPVGFPEGLTGSTQFTISLPVSRLRLLTVRASIGMLETVVATLVLGSLAWGLFPSVRAISTPADFAKLLFIAVLFLAVLYSAGVFFSTFVDEPLSFVLACWSVVLLWWLLHFIAPAVNIARIWGQASPLITHKLPWSQMAECVALAMVLLLAAVRVAQTREY
jgi:hypothetical protein